MTQNSNEVQGNGTPETVEVSLADQGEGLIKGKKIKPIGTHSLRWSEWACTHDVANIPDAPGQYQARFTKDGKPTPIKRKNGMKH